MIKGSKKDSRINIHDAGIYAIIRSYGMIVTAMLLLIVLSSCGTRQTPLMVEENLPMDSTLTVTPSEITGIITVTGGTLTQDNEMTPTEPIIPTNPIISPTPDTPAEENVDNPLEQPLDNPTDETGDSESKPRFDMFVDAVKNGKKDQIVGVYVDNILALRVVQQPPNNPAFVSTIRGVATQFLLAFQVANNVGLLAHNYLAGASFFNLKSGDLIQVVYGDGAVIEYLVSEVYKFQALSPRSPSSDFVDLDSGERLTANTLFYRMYGGEEHLTFQTCIQEGTEDSWGRLFIIATPQ